MLTLTGLLQLTGSLTAAESNGAGRAESITGHNRFSHRIGAWEKQCFTAVQTAGTEHPLGREPGCKEMFSYQLVTHRR